MKRMFHEPSVLDEREQMEMYRIDHVGLWAMYVLLCAAVVAQMMMDAPLVQMAGELIVLGAVSAALFAAYARKGIWDAHSRPSVRGNAAYSAACAAGVAVIVACVRGSFLWGLFAGAAMLCLCFALLQAMMRLLHSRQSREAQALEEDEIDS